MSANPARPLEATPAPPGRTDPPAGTDVPALLERLAREGTAGELVVRLPVGAARVFLVDGRVAWAWVDDGAPRFSDVLVSAGIVSLSEIADVIDDCRRTGGNFCETLVAWDLVARDRLRELLRQHVAAAIAKVLSQPASHALFVPQQRSYDSDLFFTLESLLPSRAAGPRVAAPDRLRERLRALLAGTGASSVALVDVARHSVVALEGAPEAERASLAAARTLALLQSEPGLADVPGAEAPESLVVTRGRVHHLVRALGAALHVVATVESGDAELGAVRGLFLSLSSHLDA